MSAKKENSNLDYRLSVFKNTELGILRDSIFWLFVAAIASCGSIMLMSSDLSTQEQKRIAPLSKLHSDHIIESIPENKNLEIKILDKIHETYKNISFSCTPYKEGANIDFGDGTVKELLSTEVIHQYTKPGVYTVEVGYFKNRKFEVEVSKKITIGHSIKVF